MGPSLRAALVVAGLTLAGVAAPFATGLSLLIQLPAALVALAVGGHAIMRLVNPDFRSLKIDEAQIHVRDRSGSRSSGKLIGSPFVSPLYVGFRWRPAEKRLPHSVGIFRGQMAGSDFRRLSALLRQREGR
ncbi:hypothetical protein G4Y73_07080 [Wenzhouxiangella sp. XN201]|nr:hypothetical protein [Wenzhouxiangella sp. XN201]